MANDKSFGPERRIKKRQDFLRIQSKGTKLRASSFLVVYLYPNQKYNASGVSRLGVTITKKVDKRAVVRNQVKRRVKEFFRLNRERFIKPVDIVVICLKGSVSLDSRAIHRELNYLLKKRGQLIT